MPKFGTSIVTPSYLPDLARCVVLAESVLAFCQGFDEHYIIVPKRDMRQFGTKLPAACRVVAAEEFLPIDLVQTPLNKLWWRRYSGNFHRGWLVQQIIKIQAAVTLGEPGVIFADSDSVFIKPFMAATLWQDDKLRCYQAPRAPLFFTDQRYLNWYSVAAQVCQRDPRQFSKAYIAQLTSMHSQTANRLCEQIQANFNTSDWRYVLLNCGDFSEYILYGCFCERLKDQNHHWFSEQQLAHSSWFYRINQLDDLTLFFDDLSSDHVAVHIQSNLELSFSDYVGRLRALQRC